MPICKRRDTRRVTARRPRLGRLQPLLLRALAAACAASQLVACATLPSDGEEGSLPNAGAGPFREIAQAELGSARAAPYVMDDDDHFTRDVSVVDLDGDPSTPAAAGFFAATLRPEGAPEDTPPDPLAPPSAIVRHDAADGRSFARAAATVLAPELDWEGGTVAAPSALRVGGEIWLYYAAAGGIGLARSADGVTFAREPAPVLAPLAPGRAGWERGATPGSPGVVHLPDGSFRMFYEVPGDGGAPAIGEARSDDGLAWERVGDGPALAPAPRPGAAAGAPDGDGEPFDSAAVLDPAPALAVSATGRPILRVYYTGRDGAGRSAIGLVARVGYDGPLQRAAAPVFGASSALAPRAPSVVVYPGFSLLFVTQAAGTRADQGYPAVAAGVAPADAALPRPEP
ncbi:uncharacterized protein SOCE26_046820 [Sorangium cellulosum]|uniref:Uncharacterized protein n=1 Tax=Sorangium cellulosum TaxID=56 RepID=A0A2L0EVA2_SORCE|nr:hypothetical protein [Sorangium cellulosum]AUX43238.1 uncharacterized protein SOCE26_046820 [Sorangium cellulosum]